MTERGKHAVTHNRCRFRTWGECDEAFAAWKRQEKTLAKEREDAREAARKADLRARIDAYIEWRKEHPSVWDSMPREPR